MRLLKLIALLAALTTAAAAVQVATAHEGSPYNFRAVLEPAPGGPASGSGKVRFRQPGDEARVVYLNVKVRGLLPNSSYTLERATDGMQDDNCVGTNWLPLGRDNFTPQPIETNHSGKGRARLSRDLSAVPAGTRLDIHFRVIDNATSATVLRSPCYQFTVR